MRQSMRAFAASMLRFRGHWGWFAACTSSPESEQRSTVMSSRNSRGAVATARSAAIVAVSAAIAFAAGACSGGGRNGAVDAGGDIECPETSDAAVEMWFPPGGGLVTADSLTVRGGACNPSTIVAVRVNGVLATTTSGHAEWEAKVPLSPGANPVIVESEDADGQIETVASLTITRTSFDLWKEVELTALDPYASRALVLEHEYYLSFLDLETGARTRIERHSGPWPASPLGIALDMANHRALLTEWTETHRGALYELDLATGVYTVLSSSYDDIGSGVPLEFPFAPAIDRAHDRAVVLVMLGDWDPPPPHVPAVMAVDLNTGDRTVLSGDGVGAGIELSAPQDLVLAPGGDIAYVLDQWRNALLSVDLSTGDRTMVASELGTATGGPYPFTRDNLEVDAANHRALAVNMTSGELLGIDLATGDHTLVADLTPVFDSHEHICALLFDGPRNRVIFCLEGGSLPEDVFMALDLATGERHRLSSTYVGAGPAMKHPSGVAWNGAVDRAYVMLGSDLGPTFSGGVMAVDVTTGTRRLITSFDEGTRLDPNTFYPVILDEDGGRLFIGDYWRGQVHAVTLTTGQRATVWDASVAFPDVDFVAVRDLALYRNELLVATTFNNERDGAVFAVALDSGASRNLPELGDLRALDISQDDGLAFVAATPSCAITAIDLATGERRQLSDISVPPGCYQAQVLAYDDVLDRLVVRFGHAVEGGAHEGPYVIDMATGDFTRIPLDPGLPGSPYGWRGLALDHHGHNLIVVDADLQALIGLDPASGQKVVLSR
jgi:DNA-binding beta-propeller fold protein YncE